MNYYNFNYNNNYNNNNNFYNNNNQYFSANNIFNSQKPNLSYLNYSRYFSPNNLHNSHESYKILSNNNNNNNFYSNHNSIKSSLNIQNQNIKKDFNIISLPNISRNKMTNLNNINYNSYSNNSNNNKINKIFENNNKNIYNYNFNKYLNSESNIFKNNNNNNKNFKLKNLNNQLNNNNNNIKTKKFVDKSEYIREYIRYAPEWYIINNKKIKRLEPTRNIFRSPFTSRIPNYLNEPSLYTYDFNKKRQLKKIEKEKEDNNIIVRYIANIHSSVYKEKKKKKKKKNKIEENKNKKESDIFLFGVIEGIGEDAKKKDNLSDVYIDGGEEMSYIEQNEDEKNN